MAEFELWTKESLISFAYDAAKRLSEAEEEIKQLQQDQKMALNAYRSLLRAADGLQQLAKFTS